MNFWEIVKFVNIEQVNLTCNTVIDKKITISKARWSQMASNVDVLYLVSYTCFMDISIARGVINELVHFSSRWHHTVYTSRFDHIMNPS